MSANLISIKTLEEFNKETSQKQYLVVIHFQAVWAPQCQQINDVINELVVDKVLTDVKFLLVEAESLPEISHKYNILAVPTCVLIKNDKEVDRINGVDIAEMDKKIRLHATKPTSAKSNSDSNEVLTDRLKKLINEAPVMIFIKGSPNQPQCGFSKTLVQILKDQNVVFKSFDILKDEQVRQGLKEYSNWPTFPQVYVKGELIGGLDIVKELVSSGEFQEMIPKSEPVETLEDRLKKLINQKAVMLFMKGSPVEPKCGFSKTIIEILNSTGVSYGHFDILSDSEVRQGLKTFSNWPTFPQLYAHGDLVGGLDIVKELRESGELDSVLKQSS